MRGAAGPYGLSRRSLTSGSRTGVLERRGSLFVFSERKCAARLLGFPPLHPVHFFFILKMTSMFNIISLTPLYICRVMMQYIRTHHLPVFFKVKNSPPDGAFINVVCFLKGNGTECVCGWNEWLREKSTFTVSLKSSMSCCCSSSWLI